MPSFTKGGGARTPLGVNQFLRSKENVKVETYTLDKDSVPFTTIDDFAGQKVLQPGTVMAKITSGPGAGKIGPFQGTSGAGTNEVQTLTKAGTVSGGTFTLAFQGDVTTPIEWNAVAGDVLAALEALPSIGAGNVSVSGGPIAATPFSVTFLFDQAGDEPMMVSDATLLTGAGAGVTVAQATQGVAGTVDGRQTLANIVGLLQTFLPWTLTVEDTEVGVVYECAAVQGWCLEMQADGTYIALSNTTAAAMQRGGAAGKSVDISFR